VFRKTYLNPSIYACTSSQELLLLGDSSIYDFNQDAILTITRFSKAWGHQFDAPRWVVGVVASSSSQDGFLPIFERSIDFLFILFCYNLFDSCVLENFQKNQRTTILGFFFNSKKFTINQNNRQPTLHTHPSSFFES
jgi:hypothetical protein